MLTPTHSPSATRLSVLTPLVPPQSSSPSPPSSSPSSASPRTTPTTIRTHPPATPTLSRTHPPTPPRTRPRAGSTSSAGYAHTHARLPRSGRARSYTAIMPLLAAGPSGSSSSHRAAPGPSIVPLERGSPPPYSPEPPLVNLGSPFLAKRAASTPHLQSPPLSPHTPHTYPHSHASSRRPSTSALCQPRARSAYPRVETDEDETDTAPSGDDAVIYRARDRTREREPEPSFASTLRERLFGKGQGRADAGERVRFITTARGAVGAGETETESEEVRAYILLYIFCSGRRRLSPRVQLLWGRCMPSMT